MFSQHFGWIRQGRVSEETDTAFWHSTLGLTFAIMRQEKLCLGSARNRGPFYSQLGSIAVDVPTTSIGRSDRRSSDFLRLQKPDHVSRFGFGTRIADDATRIKVPTLYPGYH
jgi:hypothetical protein